MANPSEALDNAFAAASAELTAVMREDAEKRGWSKSLTEKMNIGYSGNLFQLNVPSNSEDEVFAKEYGTENEPPTAVLRKLSGNPKAEAVLQKYVEENVVPALEGALLELL
jgi:hypothetical protein